MPAEDTLSHELEVQSPLPSSRAANVALLATQDAEAELQGGVPL